MSTNPTPVELKPCDPVAQISEICGQRCVRLNTIPEHGFYIVEADFEDGTRLKTGGPSQADAWRLFRLAATRPPASAAPVDELVEDATWLRGLALDFEDQQSAFNRVNRIADQLTIYARRVAELADKACAAIDAVKSPYDHHSFTGEDCAFGDALEAAQNAVRAALTGEQG